MMHGTVAVIVKRDNKVAVGVDGRLVRGDTILKEQEPKMIEVDDNVLVLQLGDVQDAQLMYDIFEDFILDEELDMAVYDTVRELRKNKISADLQAEIIVCTFDKVYEIANNGALIEYDLKDKDVLTFGSGSEVAYGVGRALTGFTNKSAEEIVLYAIAITSQRNIYCNNNLQVRVLKRTQEMGADEEI